MDLERAQAIAHGVMERLRPLCTKIEVAGSIRRGRPFVNDIDIVLIPKDPWNLRYEIAGLGPIILKGDKIQRVIHDDVQVDIYFAEPKTWATLLLIRTGSKKSNIRLTTLAKKKGWKLHASGSGLFDENGQRIAGDTEEGIFEVLGLPYQRPEERD